MKTALKTTAFAALLLAPFAVSPAAAQPAPFNEVGVTMGHWHIVLEGRGSQQEDLPRLWAASSSPAPPR